MRIRFSTFAVVLLLGTGIGVHAQVPTPVPNPTNRELAQFGAAVDVDGDLAVVGSPFDRVDGVWTGGAYVFRLTGGAWTLEDTLRPVGFDPLTETQFGAAVAVSGDVVVVTAPAEWVGNASSRGAVYVFRRQPDGAWTLETELTQAPSGDLRYAAAIDLEGDVLVVGATDRFVGPPGQNGGGARVAGGARTICQYGEVYEPARVEVLRYDGERWARTDSLVAPDGRIGTRYGAAVSLDGGVVAVGAPVWYTSRLCDEPEAEELGRAYVFRQGDAGWAAEATLVLDDAAEGDLFGAAVAASGDRVVVGAPLRDGAAFGSGAAFSYVADGAGWSLESEFVGEGTVELDRFGSALDLQDDYVVVGSPGVRAGEVFGATYGFRYMGGAWEQGFRVAVDIDVDPLPDATYPFGLGEAVALDGSHVLIGAPFFADYGPDRDLGPGSVSDIGRAFSFTREDYLRLSGLLTDEEGTPVSTDGSPPDAGVALHVPWPNPMVGRSTVSFSLTAPGDVWVDLVDVVGRRVAVLVSGEPYGAGRHAVPLDASALPAGVYVVRLRMGAAVHTQRVTVAR